MFEEVNTAESADTVRLRPDRGDVRTLAELYAVHGAHVFDYCRALVGSDAIAASATSAALASGRQLPPDSHLVRARLITTARREALAFVSARPGWPRAAARPESGNAAAAALHHLPASHREVLALVYRHGILAEQLAEVLGVPARDAYERLAAAEHDFVTAATAQGPAGSSAPISAVRDPADYPSLEDIGALPLAPVPASVWRDAMAELAAPASVAATVPRAKLADRAAGSLARPRRRLQLIVAAALPAVAVACWAIVAGVGSAHPVGVHDAGEPSAVRIAPQTSWSTATPQRADTSPAGQGTVPVRPGSAPTIPVLALLPSTPAGTVLPITGASANPALITLPSAAASPSSSPSSAAPTPAASTSSAAPSASPSASPSTSASASPSAATSSTASSPSPSDSASSASPSVPDPSPTS